jgi:hypothetical protein
MKRIAMKKSSYIVLTIATSLVIFTACKKKFDLPAEPAPLPASSYITIDSIKKVYSAYYSPTATPTSAFKFNTDVTLRCMVTADEVSGNLYKSVFVRDNTGAIQLKLVSAGGLAVGDSITVNLNGVILNDYGKLIQLDSIQLEKKVRKISSGSTIDATKVTMQQLITNLPKWESKLIRLDSVEFDNGGKSQPYADAVNKQSIDRTIINATGTSMIVRTSGYSNFAAVPIPCGKGSITAIVGQYNGTVQLTLRSINDVALSSGNCPILVKNFNDNIGSGGWTTAYPTGTMNPNNTVIPWTIGKFGGKSYANITNYSNFTNKLCESWLLSPALNLTNTNNPMLSFINACNFSGPVIQAFVSTNYTTGNDPNTATWTALTFSLSSGGFAWVNSGNIPLSAYKTSNVTIAFKYTGTSTSGKTWEIDDVAIIDN